MEETDPVLGWSVLSDPPATGIASWGNTNPVSPYEYRDAVGEHFFPERFATYIVARENVNLYIPENINFGTHNISEGLIAQSLFMENWDEDGKRHEITSDWTEIRASWDGIFLDGTGNPLASSLYFEISGVGVTDARTFFINDGTLGNDLKVHYNWNDQDTGFSARLSNLTNLRMTESYTTTIVWQVVNGIGND